MSRKISPLRSAELNPRPPETAIFLRKILHELGMVKTDIRGLYRTRFPFAETEKFFFHDPEVFRISLKNEIE
jgi:NACalpha-BTF3-like transcription factor